MGKTELNRQIALVKDPDDFTSSLKPHLFDNEYCLVHVKIDKFRPGKQFRWRF
ncbi:MAG TPA: hypothetical protein PLI88_03595 [Bacillota bacterium]|nr:hypothetical protein [Bacillota bacterium]HOH10814.1 hypothetical protein [Bacillota bacterium]HOY88499.1 hypothetical protein [Bacillota bacterium]HPI01218.1 hypothetical protein [Bacillota bacterium]HQJ24502.1 hypothetical protein [Bacillota bacterium]